MYAAIPRGEVTPGTTSKGIPASTRPSTSSPPRPKMNGSPPFRRTTVKTPLCTFDEHLHDLILGERVIGPLLADVNALGIRARPAQYRGIGQIVVEDRVGERKYAPGFQCEKLGIARSCTGQINLCQARASPRVRRQQTGFRQHPPPATLRRAPCPDASASVIGPDALLCTTVLPSGALTIAIMSRRSALTLACAPTGT